MDNVDVAALSALLLQPPQFSGRLNASAVVSGTTAMPSVKADFRIDGGGFRQFHYDTLGGTASYDNKGVVIDARLQQNPTQWLTAKGFLPKALFASGVEASSDPVDLSVDSSPIDLGIVQGFTTQLTKVTGTLEAHVHVAGSAAAPEPTGAITIQNGAARVEPTGVSYSHIAGKIELRPTAAHIDEITVLDSGNNALSITGDLAVREGGLGGVQLYVNASDFKLLDNKVGDIHMQTNLEIAGDIASPRITGDVALTKGKIDLDQVYDLAGASPYATTETQYETTTSPSAPVAAAPAPAPGAFEALAVDVGLSVPNDFVVKANDLQTPGAPIGLGALNLTIGGDLHANKVPGGTVRVRGTVNTVRGTYDFQGRRFDILRDGTVRFDGLEELDPTLNLRAERLIQGVTAQVNVRGTLYKPQIVLTSTPPLEQADILSLIVFNQPINQMSEGQQISLASRAESMAAGAVTNQLAQSIGRALNLDTFEINLAPETGGGPEVTVGQQVSQNLYVKVQQGVGDESSTNFVLEYELSKWLRLQTNVLQGASNQQTMFRRAREVRARICCSSSAIRGGLLGDRERRHLHARVVETGAAADVGQRVGDERGARRAVPGGAPPEAFRKAHRPRPHARGYGERAMHLAEIVEHAHEIVVAQAARRGVSRIHRELDVRTRQLAERRADRAIARRRNQCQRIPVRFRIRLERIEACRRA